MNVVLRNTKVGDYSEIKKLLDQSGLGGGWFTRDLLAKLVRRNRTFNWVAVGMNDHVLGTIFASHDGGYHGYVCKLAVDNNYLRRGLGRRLLECVKGSFVVAGIDWYIALVRKNNRPSKKLFSASGFKTRDVFHVFEFGDK